MESHMKSAVSKTGYPLKKIGLLSLLKKHRIRYLMLLPGVILILIFAYLPLTGWSMAFVHYELGQGVLKSSFAGLQYFANFFEDSSEAIYTLRNTLIINISILASGLVLGCVFAILLNEVKIKFFKNLTQLSSFSPFFISSVIVYSIFNSFLAVNNGMINQILVNNKIIPEGINFLGDPKLSWPLILFVNIWKGFGANSIIFLASISGIDQGTAGAPTTAAQTSETTAEKSALTVKPLDLYKIHLPDERQCISERLQHDGKRAGNDIEG
jgi:putative aldouronate transport system permease protein